MKIILAKAAGFCMGVRRAMNIVLDESRHHRSVMTHGPLIHNPQVIEMLREKGVRIFGKDGKPEPGGTVVIRAHGITPDEKKELCDCGYNVVEATCPHVIRIQKLIQKHVGLGEKIIIIGDPGHAEVDGLLGYADGNGYVVEKEEDIEALPRMERVCVVSQTTQSYEKFDRLLQLIQARWPQCTVHRTICGSTDKRQTETIELASSVDAMIVVGGKKSANTVRLAELAAETGTPTYHVETADELDLPKLRGAARIGVTAGASTSNWMIVDVTERIGDFFRAEWPLPARALYQTHRFLLDTSLFLAFGAVSMGYACALMQQRSPQFLALAIAGLYIFAMYALNIYSQLKAERYKDPSRWRFHERWGRLQVASGVAAIGGALVLAFFQGKWSVVLVALASAAGIFYRLPLIPARWFAVLRHRRLIDIPGSKDLFMALAWALMLTVLPLLDKPLASHPVAIAVTFLLVFTLVFTRSVVFDLRDIQSDQIVGRETIPIVLGKERTRFVLGGLAMLAMIGIVASTWAGPIPSSVGYVMLLPLIYTMVYLYLYHRRSIQYGVVFETILDGQFILVGLLALIWTGFGG